jgi:hypothetical protein
MNPKTILITVNEGEEKTAETAKEKLQVSFPEHRIIVGIIKR